MKPVAIDFVPDTRWRRVWAGCALGVLVLAGLWGWQAWQQAVALATLDEQIGQTEQQLLKLRAPTTSNPRLASARQAAQLLQVDLNKAFATVENIREPGVRLRSFQLDPGSDRVRLEYELDSMAKAAAITSLLNTGYSRAPWQLEGVSTTGGGTQAGVMSMSQTVRGIWSAPLGKL